jgi:hypothetical protein
MNPSLQNSTTQNDLLVDERKAMGECVICEEETYKVLFSNAIVKTYICSEKCLREYFKPVGQKVRVQKKLKENNGWLD